MWSLRGELRRLPAGLVQASPVTSLSLPLQKLGRGERCTDAPYGYKRLFKKEDGCGGGEDDLRVGGSDGEEGAPKRWREDDGDSSPAASAKPKAARGRPKKVRSEPAEVSGGEGGPASQAQAQSSQQQAPPWGQRPAGGGGYGYGGNSVPLFGTGGRWGAQGGVPLGLLPDFASAMGGARIPSLPAFGGQGVGAVGSGLSPQASPDTSPSGRSSTGGRFGTAMDSRVHSHASQFGGEEAVGAIALPPGPLQQPPPGGWPTRRAPASPASYVPYLDEQAVGMLPLLRELPEDVEALLRSSVEEDATSSRAPGPPRLCADVLSAIISIAASASVELGGMVVPLGLRASDRVRIRPIVGAVAPPLASGRPSSGGLAKTERVVVAQGGMQMELGTPVLTAAKPAEGNPPALALGGSAGMPAPPKLLYAADTEPEDRLGLYFVVQDSDVGFRTAEDYIRTLAVPSSGASRVPDDILDELVVGSMLQFTTPLVSLRFSPGEAQPRVRFLFSNRRATSLLLPSRTALSSALYRTPCLPWLHPDAAWQERRRFLFARAIARKHGHYAFRGRYIMRVGDALAACISETDGCSLAQASAAIAASVSAHGLGRYLSEYEPRVEVGTTAGSEGQVEGEQCVYVDATEVGCLDLDAAGELRSVTLYYARMRLCAGAEAPAAADVGLDGQIAPVAGAAAGGDSDVPMPLPLSPAQRAVLARELPDHKLT